LQGYGIPVAEILVTAKGLDVDLSVAAQLALQEAVNFLQTEKGMSAAAAYALSSLAIDLGIREAVDIVSLVYARVPKDVFRANVPYWFTPLS
jgi:acetamidase/formamidase